MKKSFASDNYSGVHPAIIKAISDANQGHVSAYGYDEYTDRAREEFKKIFGDVEVFFAINGTGANVLALEAMKGKSTSVICPESAHIFQDETGAPVKISGVQLLTVPCKDGKLTVEGVKKWLSFKDNFHRPNPKIISISQATEEGTIYTLAEIKEICDFAKQHDMFVHMDGARISNACVALGVTFKEMCAGIDVLSFGGTKNGLMMGEAVVFFNKSLAKDFEYIRKQNLQLYSKMRFMSAQFIPYLKDNVWYECAKQANDMAKYLETELKNISITVTNEVLGNTVFAVLPVDMIAPLQQFCHFYVWNETTSVVRFVTSFDTTKEDVDAFIQKMIELKK